MSDSRRRGGTYGARVGTIPARNAPLSGERIVEQRKGSALPRHLQGHIGRQLRAVYAELINEPVPDKIADVLEQLKAREAGEPEA